MGNSQGATFNDQMIAEFSRLSGLSENQVDCKINKMCRETFWCVRSGRSVRPGFIYIQTGGWRRNVLERKGHSPTSTSSHSDFNVYCADLKKVRFLYCLNWQNQLKYVNWKAAKLIRVLTPPSASNPSLIVNVLWLLICRWWGLSCQAGRKRRQKRLRITFSEFMT